MNDYFSNKDLKRYHLSKRKSKVSLKQFGKPAKGKVSFKKFMESLPDILSAKDLVVLAGEIIRCRSEKKTVILMMGAHPVKCGLSEYIIDLLKDGYITYIATNGATAIHDFEIAFCGKTSEDVKEMLISGRFGLAEETGKLLNEAINSGADTDSGMGESIGRMIYQKKLKYKNSSILYNAYRLKRFVTCHVAIGTDIIHQHPETDPGKLGKATYLDFLRFTNRIKDLENGIIINLGSAVIMPEVFLKAINLVRNKGHKVNNFISVNMDMQVHYRPLQNVLSRPVGIRGKSINILGRHEINVPLLYQIIQTLQI